MESYEKPEEPSLVESVLVIVSYMLLLLRGHIMELCWKIGFRRVACAGEPKNTRVRKQNRRASAFRAISGPSGRAKCVLGRGGF